MFVLMTTEKLLHDSGDIHDADAIEIWQGADNGKTTSLDGINHDGSRITTSREFFQLLRGLT